MLVEGQDGIPEERRRRDVAGYHEQPDEPDDLLVIEPFPVHLRGHQVAREIVRGMSPASLDVREEVGVHFPHGRSDCLEQRRVQLDLRGLLVERQHRVGPGVEEPTILEGNAKQLGDHRHW